MSLFSKMFFVFKVILHFWGCLHFLGCLHSWGRLIFEVVLTQGENNQEHTREISNYYRFPVGISYKLAINKLMPLNFTILSGTRKLIKVYQELTLEYCHNCCWKFGCNWWYVCMSNNKINCIGVKTNWFINCCSFCSIVDL